jgi:hypothetical protein
VDKLVPQIYPKLLPAMYSGYVDEFDIVLGEKTAIPRNIYKSTRSA